MQSSAEMGLRERKRAQTSEAIHVAAAELVLERGLEATTIDAVSERADVSPRTFFNYFSSKEDAVLGIDEIAVSAELDRERDYAGDPLAATFDLVYALFEASGGRHAKTALKREVLQKNPQLMTRQMVRVAELEGRLSGILAGWLADDPRFAGGSDAERLEEAQVILGICLATVRVSMRRWATQSDGDPGGAPTASAPDPRRSYEQAIASLRTVLEKLS
ncbi:TetR/AcrR family transcriptional regulator [Herbiconiux sp. YIM B11900]|uniref:TetR/AcrR family transcriptional regulator n=1 Tax=Herbiconiux sp. YIM B11900 TaxID=3404131 RepID=UPI003F848B20